MDNGHISRRDWMVLFSTRNRDAEWMRTQSHVMAHVNECAQCREFYEKGMALQEAARAVVDASARFNTDSAYRAVASAEAPRSKTKQARGFLCVCVDSGAEKAMFIEDTLEAEGCANKYALNPESEGRCLLDDEGALCLELRKGQLRIALGDGEPRCECQLLAENEEVRHATVKAGHEAAIDLPPESFCTLEMTFTEGR